MNNDNKDQDKEKEVQHVGSTTQGGSNFGQGQSSLGKQQQGTEKSIGSSYENEQGWNNEALRFEDLEQAGKKEGNETEQTENGDIIVNGEVINEPDDVDERSFDQK